MPALWSAEAAWHETELHLVTDNDEQKQRNGTAWPPRVVGNIGLLFSSYRPRPLCLWAVDGSSGNILQGLVALYR